MPPPFIDGEPDAPNLNLRVLIAAADGTVRQQADAARKTARAAAKPHIEEARERWVEETAAAQAAPDDSEAREKIAIALRRAAPRLNTS